MTETNTNIKGGTFRLSEIAQVTVRGGDIQDQAGFLASAWKAWHYILSRAQREGKEAPRFGREGWEVRLEIHEVFHTLWPAGATPITGKNHDEARRELTMWLCTHQNLASVSRGNSGINNRRVVLSSRASVWWAAAEFSGAPEGFEFPKTAAETEELAPPDQLATGALPAPEEGADWWCPYYVKCGIELPLTQEDLRMHLMRAHKFKIGTMLMDIGMQDAEDLRVAGGLAPPEPEPEPVPVSLAELASMSSIDREPVTPPVRAVTAPPPVPVSVAPRTVQATGTFTAQARVFMGQVTELEAENDRLRREVEDLRQQLKESKQQQLVNLTATSADALARRIAELVKSEGELS